MSYCTIREVSFFLFSFVLLNKQKKPWSIADYVCLFVEDNILLKELFSKSRAERQNDYYNSLTHVH